MKGMCACVYVYVCVFACMCIYVCVVCVVCMSVCGVNTHTCLSEVTEARRTLNDKTQILNTS